MNSALKNNVSTTQTQSVLTPEPEMDNQVAKPLLRVRDLSVAFLKGSFGKADQADQSITVVDRISFDIASGETLALVGESGSGKSMTAHAIMKLLPYPVAFHPGGSVEFEGEEILHNSPKQMQKLRGRRIGMIFQEPMTALNPLHSVGKQISEILSLHSGLRQPALRNKVIELLERVQLPEPEKRLGAYPHELSGGQRQRVMIAMALANEPTLLIADEPTTALDVTVQREILLLLQSLQKEMGMAMLLITHDLGVVRHMAQRVAVMHQGKLIEQQPCEALFTDPQQEYTRSLLNSEPANSTPIADDGPHTTLLETKNLSISFPLNKPLFGKPTKFLHAVKKISLTLKAGQTLGIVGESGSGKSTLAMAVLRLLKSSGEINFEDHALHLLNERKLRPLRRHMQVVFQDPFASLSPRMTVSEIIAEGLLVHSELGYHEREEVVIKAMQEVGLEAGDRHRYPHEFSGGQRQRIAIARALVLNPKLLILDEPTSALDRAVQVQVVDLLRDLQRKRGLTYLFISHDLKVVRALSHQVLVMKDGQMIEYGDTEQVLSNPKQAYTQALLDASFL